MRRTRLPDPEISRQSPPGRPLAPCLPPAPCRRAAEQHQPPDNQLQCRCYCSKFRRECAGQQRQRRSTAPRRTCAHIAVSEVVQVLFIVPEI